MPPACTRPVCMYVCESVSVCAQSSIEDTNKKRHSKNLQFFLKKTPQHAAVERERVSSFTKKLKKYLKLYE